jgi:hypothetical protein
MAVRGDERARRCLTMRSGAPPVSVVALSRIRLHTSTDGRTDGRVDGEIRGNEGCDEGITTMVMTPTSGIAETGAVPVGRRNV